MRNRITRHSAAAVLEMQSDGVLIVRMTGPLTADAMAHFKAQIVARHAHDVRGFVADYTGAVVAMTGAELDAVLEGEPDGSAPTMPAAMVVRPEQIKLFRGHALRVAASHGIIRRLFTERDPALAWVRHLVRRQTP